MKPQWLLKLIVFGWITFSLSASSAESLPFLIPIFGTQDAAIDYNSIQLEGERPTFNMRYKINTPIVLYGKTYEVAYAQFSLNCSTLQAQATANYKFVDGSGNVLLADMKLYSPVQKIALKTAISADGLQPLCMLKQHGFLMPRLVLNEKWEEMRSPSSASKVFEAPSARQYRDDFLLIKQKNEFPPGTKFDDKDAPINLVISLFDCRNVESRLMTAIRLDGFNQPISGIFGTRENVTPRLPENRQRMLDACQSMRLERQRNDNDGHKPSY